MNLIHADSRSARSHTPRGVLVRIPSLFFLISFGYFCCILFCFTLPRLSWLRSFSKKGWKESKEDVLYRYTESSKNTRDYDVISSPPCSVLMHQSLFRHHLSSAFIPLLPFPLLPFSLFPSPPHLTSLFPSLPSFFFFFCYAYAHTYTHALASLPPLPPFFMIRTRTYTPPASLMDVHMLETKVSFILLSLCTWQGVTYACFVVFIHFP